jgi:hypothetical protein
VPRKDGTACTYGAHDDYSAAFTRFRDAVAVLIRVVIFVAFSDFSISESIGGSFGPAPRKMSWSRAIFLRASRR